MARGLAGMVNPRMQVQDQHLYRWAYLVAFHSLLIGLLLLTDHAG